MTAAPAPGEQCWVCGHQVGDSATVVDLVPVCDDQGNATTARLFAHLDCSDRDGVAAALLESAR